MSLLDNRKLYLEQWVETATKGKVEIEWASFVKRMMLACTVCKQTLIAPIPEDVNTLDYSVQEFVKIHSHSGAHHSGCSCVSCTSTTAFPKDAFSSPNCTHVGKGTTALVKHVLPNGSVLTKCALCGETWTAVTADFKKIEAKVISEPPMESGGQSQMFDYGELTNLPKAAKTPATQMAPPNYDKDAAKIAAQLKNFKKEYANKTDASNIEKIKALQAEEISAKQQQMLEDMKAKNEINEEMLKAQIAKQAALNVAKLKNFQDFQAMPELAILKSTPSPVPEPVKKSPVKKDVQGRKFR
jgi:hypothetical protein